MARLYEGGVFLHPEEGPIYITDGAYEIGGRVSNAWGWKKVNPDGTLGKKGHGYGTTEWPELDADITVMVKIKYQTKK